MDAWKFSRGKKKENEKRKKQNGTESDNDDGKRQHDAESSCATMLRLRERGERVVRSRTCFRGPGVTPPRKERTRLSLRPLARRCVVALLHVSRLPVANEMESIAWSEAAAPRRSERERLGAKVDRVESKVLARRERATLLDGDAVAETRHLKLVVCKKLFGMTHTLPVLWVRNHAVHAHHARLHGRDRNHRAPQPLVHKRHNAREERRTRSRGVARHHRWRRKRHGRTNGRRSEQRQRLQSARRSERARRSARGDRSAASHARRQRRTAGGGVARGRRRESGAHRASETPKRVCKESVLVRSLDSLRSRIDQEKRADYVDDDSTGSAGARVGEAAARGRERERGEGGGRERGKEKEDEEASVRDLRGS